MNSTQEYRKKAEEILSKRKENKKFEGKSQEEIITELQIHQIELEMQNEELQETQYKLQLEKEKYNDLFENAPFGYCNIDKEGRITEANQTFKKMLLTSNEELLDKKLSDLIDPQFQDIFYIHLHNLNKGENNKAECEIKLRKNDNSKIWVKVQSHKISNKVRNAVIDITKNKKMEQDLWINKEKYRTILNSIGDAVIASDLDGKILQMNPVAEELTEWYFENAKSKHIDTILNLVNSKTRETIPTPYKKIITSGGVVGLANHTVLISKTGKEYQIADSGAPIYDKDENIIGVVIVFKDITKIYEKEQKIKQNERRLQNMFNTIPDLISIHDPDYNIVYSNWKGFGDIEESKRKLGQKCYEAYRNFSEVCPDCRMAEVLRTGKRFQDELMDAKGHWVDLRILPLFDENNKVEYAMEWVRDISARKKMELDLKRERDFIKAIMDTSPVAITTVDKNGKLNFGNKKAIKLLGLYDENLNEISYDDSYWDIEDFDGNDFPNDKLPFNIVKRTKKPIFNVKHAIKKSDGERVYLSINSAPLFDSDGNFKGMVSTIHDITREYKNKQEKESLERQYRQSQKMEAVGRIAGGVAHDLNNMLTPIIGYSELIQQEIKADEEIQEFIKEVVDSAKNAKNLIKQLLAFSRKQALNFQPLDLNKLIESFVKLMKRTIKEEVTIDTELEDRLPFIHGDKGQIKQIILNLFVNAQDAMSEGGRIRIKTLTEKIEEDLELANYSVKEGNYIKMIVEDNGTGIEKEYLEKIFDPFFTTKDVGKGTGLGLSMVYGIVRQHNGFIFVESEINVGTIFTILFPIMKKKSELNVRNQETTEIKQGEESVLLVEDNREVRRYTKKVLKKYNYNVFSAESGKKALTLLNKIDKEIALLITDIVMPDMNGKKLYQKIKKDYPHLKVLYISGYTRNIIDEKGIKNDKVNFLKKPFTPKELTNAIREILD